MRLRSLCCAIAPERWLLSLLAIACCGIAICAPSFGVPTPAQQATGDAKRGEDLVHRRCGSCHTLDSDKEGPRLRGVYGRKVASVPGFNYSEALKASKVVWDADSLDKWLTDTDKFIPDSDMDISLRNAQERADIISFLKQLSVTPAGGK